MFNQRIHMLLITDNIGCKNCIKKILKIMYHQFNTKKHVIHFSLSIYKHLYVLKEKLILNRYENLVDFIKQ